MIDIDRPAFPQPIATTSSDALWITEIPGLTIRQHAALTLRIPDSGDAALDAMIRAAVRRDLAAQAMQNPAICTGQASEYDLADWFGGRAGIRREEIAAKQAARYADALLAELERTR